MFNRFQVTAVSVTLHAGLVRLTADQASRRAHAIKAAGKKGEFEILQPINFKRGEIVEYNGDVPKALAEDLEAVQKAKAKADAEKAALRAKMLAELNDEIAAIQADLDKALADQAAAPTPEAKAALDDAIAAIRADLAEAQNDLAQLGG